MSSTFTQLPRDPGPAPGKLTPAGPLGPPGRLWGAVWALAALGLAAVWTRRFFPGELTDPSAIDCAQIARHIAAGHGFATGIIRPLAVSGFVSIDPLSKTTPDISHAPLFPLLLSFVFLLHGGRGGGPVVVLVTMTLFLAGALAAYALGRTLFGREHQPWAALLAAGLYVLGGEALRFAAAGLPVLLSMLLVSWLTLALHRTHRTPERPARSRDAFQVGLLLGLCFLAQYSLLLLLPPTLLYLGVTRARGRAGRDVGLCVLGFLLGSGLWLIRCARLGGGNPFFSMLLYDVMANTTEYPGLTTVYRSALPPETPLIFFFSHGAEMAAKAGRGLLQYQGYLPQAFNVLLLAPALTSLLWRFSDARVNALRAWAFCCLLLLVGVTSFFNPSVQTLAPFLPFVAALGVGFVFDLLRRQDWPAWLQRTAVWLLAAGVGLGVLSQLAGRRPPPLNPVSGGLSLLGPYTPAATQGAIITDAPWDVTWRTQLPAVWLPADNQAYEAVIARGKTSSRQIQANALLLTPEISSYNYAEGEATAWVLLSAHPLAVSERDQALGRVDDLPQQLDQQAKKLTALAAAGDPGVQETPAQLQEQIAQARAALPARIRSRKGEILDAFQHSYGDISDVLKDFQPVAQRPEHSQMNSTLFLRRSVLPAQP